MVAAHRNMKELDNIIKKLAGKYQQTAKSRKDALLCNILTSVDDQWRK